MSNGLKGTIFQFQEKFQQNNTFANPFRRLPNQINFKGRRFCSAQETPVRLILDFDLETKIVKTYDEIQQYLAGDLGLTLQQGKVFFKKYKEIEMKIERKMIRY